MRNKSFIIILIAIFIGIIGCTSYFKSIQEEQINSPIPVKGYNLIPFYIYDISFNLIPGVIIGGHYDGVSRIKQQNYFAPSSPSRYWKEEHLTIFIDECTKAGYKISLDLENNSLLSSEKIIVVGSVDNIDIKTYSDIVSELTEVSIIVIWEFYSSTDGNLIYKSSVTGKSKLSGMAVDLVSLMAFRNSVKNLLADSVLVNTIVGLSKNNPTINKYSLLY